MMMRGAVRPAMDVPARRTGRAAPPPAATKRAIRGRLLRLAKALGAPRPKRLADGWLLLVEGAYALSQTMGGGAGAASRALPWASEAMLEEQIASAAAGADHLRVHDE